MSLHLDGMMDVRLADGTIERRRYSISTAGASPLGGTRGGLPVQYEPELLDGEEVMWTIGDIVPTIVRLRPIEREREPDTFNPSWEQY